MRKLLIGLALLGACTPTAHSTPIPNAVRRGAVGPAEAVNTFLIAAKREDLPTMNALWGTKDGPGRTEMKAEERDMRDIVVARCLRHDSYEIVSDKMSINGNHTLSVAVTRKSLTTSHDFITAQGPDHRWYVQDAGIRNLTGICLQT